MNFSAWHQYFISNQQHFEHIDWLDNRSLSTEELTCITSSIRQFQRGEHSEGKHFLEFAQSMKDESYVETVRVFIKEEQDHAMVLGRFMDMHGINRLKNDWLDNVFRRLRKLAGLEGTITVLLTAEIIAIPYYIALKKATASPLLKQICSQVLTDEEMHLRFQSYTLRLIYQRKRRIATVLSRFLHMILMTGTIAMVWFYHRKVLRAGGFGFTSYARMTWQEFMRCRAMMRNQLSSKPIIRKNVVVAQPASIA
jgi:rubrerythrin